MTLSLVGLAKEGCQWRIVISQRGLVGEAPTWEELHATMTEMVVITLRLLPVVGRPPRLPPGHDGNRDGHPTTGKAKRRVSNPRVSTTTEIYGLRRVNTGTSLGGYEARAYASHRVAIFDVRPANCVRTAESDVVPFAVIPQVLNREAAAALRNWA